MDFHHPHNTTTPLIFNIIHVALLAIWTSIYPAYDKAGRYTYLGTVLQKRFIPQFSVYASFFLSYLARNLCYLAKLDCNETRPGQGDDGVSEKANCIFLFLLSFFVFYALNLSHSRYPPCLATNCTNEAIMSIILLRLQFDQRNIPCV
ncbi:hypothetical protein F4677DRAFT_391380 [Hypoxylon crocopeplum]|nr:hypothetical protein F4677DRAFT_391380 [Hypoxylon crocopeplum]